MYSSYTLNIDTHTKCNIPANFAFTDISDTDISVQWESNNNSESTIYELESSSETDTNFYLLIATSSFSYAHSGLTPNVTYFYKVRAKNLDGIYSGYAAIDTLNGFTLCTIPGDPTYSNIMTNSIDIAWDSNGNSSATKYELSASSDNSNWKDCRLCC